MTPEERFLAAARRQPVDRTPVWFMRQAGRCLPAYRELRKSYDILTLAKTPDLCAEVTLMPVDTFKVDGAVMFADIMLPMEPMGISLEIQPEIGPIIHNPIRSQADVDALRVLDAEEATPFVFDAIRLVRRELGNRAALIGFSGAPFTLACYLIEGRPSREYNRAKGLMFSEPKVWHALMATVSEVVVRYLRAQVTAGAQVLQLFDSWVGALSPRDYEEYVLPHTHFIFESLKDCGVPTIHFGTGTAALLERLAHAGGDIQSVDWRVHLDEAWERVGFARGIQGNLDPVLLLTPWPRLQQGVDDVLRRAAGRPGHIFNLGHGVLPNTPVEHVQALAKHVHAWRA
ncbi:MAG TPA: uroporphyrinogen decarboxylase [Chloroflexota bacterium]|nr:uroporphyrinogen decarboxylase [Chloroflexota bacterium]